MKPSAAATSASQDALLLAQIVDGLLQDMPDAVSTAVLVSAVPRWFDEALLSRLIENSVTPETVIETLMDCQLVSRDDDGRFTFISGVRQILLPRARQVATFNNANQEASDYFIDRAKAAPAFTESIFQRESIYHQIVLGEACGIRQLLDYVEDNLSQYQNGSAQDAVNIIMELQPSLSEIGRVWQRYLQARMDWVYRRGQLDFALLTGVDEPLIAALAQWHIGQIHLANDNWTQAIQACQQSRCLLEQQDEIAYVGRVMLTLGDAYLSLSQSCGGMIDAEQPDYSRFNQLLNFFQHGPFNLYRYLLTRTSWFPQRRYVGTNYQDWIITFLLRRAGDWYQQAADQFARSQAVSEQLDATIALADVELETGRPTLADKRLDGLLQTQSIRNSPYRLACVYRIKGLVQLAQKRPHLALDYLRPAANFFGQLQAKERLAATQRAIGRAYAMVNNKLQAEQAFRQSCDEYGLIGDRLTQTQVVWQRETVVSVNDDRLLLELPERHYISRFPATLLRRFRRLAVLWALPVSYIAGLFMAAAVLISLMIVESIIRIPVQQVGLLAATDLVILILGILLPLPLTLWLYRLFYTMMGVKLIHDLVAEVKPLEKEQPDRIVTSPDQFVITNVIRGKLYKLAWTEVKALVTVDYCLWQRPIHLVSSTFVVKEGSPILFEAITAGYHHLLVDVAERIKKDAIRSLNFRILGGWSTLIALLVAVLHAFFVVFVFEKVALTGTLEPDAVIVPLHFSSIMVVLVPTLWFLLPAVTMARLLHHHRQIARLEERIPKSRINKALWISLGVTAVFALGWMVLLLTITL